MMSLLLSSLPANRNCHNRLVQLPTRFVMRLPISLVCGVEMIPMTNGLLIHSVSGASNDTMPAVIRSGGTPLPAGASTLFSDA